MFHIQRFYQAYCASPNWNSHALGWIPSRVFSEDCRTAATIDASKLRLISEYWENSAISIDQSPEIGQFIRIATEAV